MIAGTNAALQAFLPAWVRARALSIHQLVLFTTFALGAALWGALAGRIGVGATFVVAGALLLVGAVDTWFRPLLGDDPGDRTTTGTWCAPEVALTPDVRTAPVAVRIGYRVAVGQHEAFLAAADRLRDSRRRTGATGWTLLRDATDEDVLVEEFTVPSWDEYARQQGERRTGFDRDAEQRMADLAERVDAPVVTFVVRR